MSLEYENTLKSQTLWKVRPFWKYKGDDHQLRRSSPEIIHWKVRAFERPFKSQSLWNGTAFQKSDPFEWKKATTINKDGRRQKFFSNEHWKYPWKKIGKKRATPAFRRASLRPFFFGLFQTSDERTNRRSKAYSQRIAAENCSNDHNTPIFN